MDDKRHWDDVYGREAPDQLSWYRPHLERSLQFIEGARIPKDAAIIDVGGGASTLGPEQCSGLEVMRYRPDETHAEFGHTFKKVGSSSEIHKTPWGKEQEFVYCYCRMSE